MTYPIPPEAFDDRLAVTGTSGAGKTYAVLGALARLLKRGSRIIAADPLGVMWGLRMLPDGVTPSPYKPVIFGGPHGDLPLTVGAASLIGETAATMSESCILDLSELGSGAAERRFMLAFLTALYRNANRDPVHLILDEADLWAPQRLMDKEGDAARLLGMTQNIVRRGRVKGFIPWLITQRPAVLSKDVLSQADGVVAMKLTASQDRDAIGAWIEGQADRAKGKEILALLPTMNLGEGVIWIPGRGVLKTATFPENQTFDSSRTPKRGEVKRKVDLKALDLGKLKDRLAKVESEAKANDPAALKARVAQLEAEVRKKTTAVAQPDADVIAKAERRAFDAGVASAKSAMKDAVLEAQDAIAKANDAAREALTRLGTVTHDHLRNLSKGIPAAPSRQRSAPEPSKVIILERPPVKVPAPKDDDPALTGALQRVLDAVAWWSIAGENSPPRDRVAVLANLSPKASTLGVYISKLAQMGLVETPRGAVTLTDEGTKQANFPTAISRQDIVDMARNMLDPAPFKVFEIVRNEYPNAISRADLAERAGLSPNASTLGVYISKVAGYGFIETPRGSVRASDWMFP